MAKQGFKKSVKYQIFVAVASKPNHRSKTEIRCQFLRDATHDTGNITISIERGGWTVFCVMRVSGEWRDQITSGSAHTVSCKS